MARSEAFARIAEAKKIVKPEVRARRVAKTLEVAVGDVVPRLRADEHGNARQGFWVTEHVLVELEAAKTASTAWSAERKNLLESLRAHKETDRLAGLERDALEAQVTRWRAGYDAEAAARTKLAEACAAVSDPPWWRQPYVWGIAGVLVGGATVGFVRR